MSSIEIHIKIYYIFYYTKLFFYGIVNEERIKERSKMRQALKFKESGMKGLHIFSKRLYFPIVVASYSDWEEQQISYLESHFQSGIFTSISICQWCINHHIHFQILYTLSIKSIFRNPYRYMQYLKLKKRLYYSL